MRVVKMLVLSGVAALTCCFAAAGSAWATPGPLWGFCSDAGGGEDAHCTGSGTGFTAKLLRVGESLLALGLSVSTIVLESTTASQTIECSGLHSHGYLEGEAPGKHTEVLVYTGCAVPAASGCNVFSAGATAGTIETQALTAELVYLTKEAAETLNAAATGMVVRPTTGTFTELELTGIGCPITTPPAAKVKGEVITEIPNATSRELLHTLVAPRTPKTEYWLDTSPLSTKDTITRINLAGHNATYLGEVSVDVSLLGHFGEWLAYWICP